MIRLRDLDFDENSGGDKTMKLIFSRLSWIIKLASFLLLAPLTSQLFDDVDDGSPSSSDRSRRQQQQPHHHHQSDAHSSDASELFLCKWCGREIFRASEGFVRRTSARAVATLPFTTVDAAGKNVTINVQRLVNPHRAVFDVITTNNAETTQRGLPETEASWFDG